ncbi:protein DEK-like [Phalaenopsis equestris]|uniref:protein DEK-like n=1 Tax=Phalaenopsis equestris TaxID=78828 RepID=UPI0009E62A33|nr:protein DEK-like [Phalaenopsis equestris]
MASQSVVEEASKEGPLNASSTDDQEGGQVTPKKRGRKRRMEEEDGEGEGGSKRKALPLDRPSRDRKSVERYAALSPIRGSASKTLSIQQGSGEKLKDIPNVAFKLLKRKADESLRVLHRILFGRKANAHFLKRNILQFSGFVWSQNEEKDKLKVKEKLNKCNKDRLLELSDLLDIYTLKVNTKKEDISAKVMEFLESPHVTREVILSEKVKKGKKLKRGVKITRKRASEEASADKEEKRKKRQQRKPSKDNIEDKVKVNSTDKDDESVDEDESSDADETDENSKSEAEDEKDEQKSEFTQKSSNEGMHEVEGLESKQHSPATTKKSPATSKKAPASSKKKVNKEINSKDRKISSNMSKTSKKSLSSSKEKVHTKGESKDINGSSKMKKEKVPIKTDLNDDSKRKASTKGDISEKADKNKGKTDAGTTSKDMKGIQIKGAKMETNSEEKQEKKKEGSVAPSREQLSAVLSEILKEVDFNVATLADIIKQLGAHFDTDLMDRKTEIKSILEEVINNMTDDEDADADANANGDEEGEKN